MPFHLPGSAAFFLESHLSHFSCHPGRDWQSKAETSSMLPSLTSEIHAMAGSSAYRRPVTEFVCESQFAANAR